MSVGHTCPTKTLEDKTLTRISKFRTAQLEILPSPKERDYTNRRVGKAGTVPTAKKGATMFDMFVKKYITVKNIIFFIIAILFLVFITKIKDIAILFFASYVVACSLNPIVDKLEKKMKRPLASALVLGGGLLTLSLFVIPIGGMAGHQIKAFLQAIPEHIDAVKEFLMNIPLIQNSLQGSVDFGEIIASASGVTTNFVNTSINASMGLATALIYFFAGCIIVYYFMADKEAVRKTYMSLFPKEMKVRAEEILDSISQKIGGYVIAQLVTIASVGIIMTIGLLILKVDYAILLGLLTSVLDLIPVVGPAIALIIMLLASYKMGAVTLFFIVVVFAIAQWAENNFVRPYIFSKFLDLHPLIIYFFLFVTAQYLGVIGVVFAPAIAATVCVLIEELYIKNVN